MSREHCHRRPEELSIRLHQAIAAKLDSNPVSTLAVARRNTARWREMHKGTGVTNYLDRWERLLDGSLEQLKAFLVSPSQEARDMRQCTPFAGVLSHKERFEIIRGFSEEWARRRTHAARSAGTHNSRDGKPTVGRSLFANGYAAPGQV